MERDAPDRDGDLEDSWHGLRSDVRRLLRDEHAADDIVQETWLRALEKAPSKNGRFRGWLHVVSRRLIFEAARSRRRRGERERLVAKPERVEGEQGGGEDSRVVRMLEGLPETYREVLRLRFVEDVETAEIARRLGRSPGTVRSQIKRGLELMRVRLRERPRDRWSGLTLLAALRERFRGAPKNAGARWTAVLMGGSCLVLAIVLSTRSELPSESIVSLDRNGGSLGSREQDTVSTAESSRRRIEIPIESAVASGTSPAAVAGTVRGAGGRPVPGAAVYASDSPKGAPRLVATTDELGRFAVQELVPTRILWAEHADWIGSSRAFLGTAPDPRAVELTLSAPFGSSRVHFVWADGTDLAGARVGVERVRTTGSEVGLRDGRLEFAPRPHETRADARGRAKVSWEYEGCHRITVTSADLPAWRYETEVAYAPEEEMRLVLPLPLALAGRVVDEARRPVPRALVEILGRDESVLGQALADELGRFEFNGVAAGPLRLRASVPASCGASCLFEGVPEAGSELELVVSERFTVCGTASDAGVLAGWTVRLVHLAGRGKVLSVRTSTTDESGRFTFPGCPLGADLRVDLLEPGVEVLFAWDSVSPDRREICLSPSRRGRATARVEGEFRARSRDELPLLVEFRSNDPETSLVLQPDPVTGRFSTPPMWRGGYGVFVWLPRLGVWRVKNVRLEDGEIKTYVLEVPQPGRICVEPAIAAGSTHEVTVRLRTDGFNAYGSGGFFKSLLDRELVAEPDGKRFVGDVPPGEYRIEILLDGDLAITKEVRVGEAQTTRCPIALEPGVPTVLKLVLPEGPPSRGESFHLTVERADGSSTSMPLSERRDIAGGAEFAVLLPFDATRLEVMSTNNASSARHKGAAAIPRDFARSASRPTLEIVTERSE